MGVSCCGRKCSECRYFPQDCLGCEEEEGRIFWLEFMDEVICPIYNCCKRKYNLIDCGVCTKHPCIRYAEGFRTEDTAEPAAALSDYASENALLAEMGIDISGFSAPMPSIEPSVILPPPLSKQKESKKQNKTHTETIELPDNKTIILTLCDE